MVASSLAHRLRIGFVRLPLPSLAEVPVQPKWICSLPEDLRTRCHLLVALDLPIKQDEIYIRSIMRLIFLMAFTASISWTKAQEPKRGLGLDLGVAPMFIYSGPAVGDNWIGAKPLFGASIEASLNWHFPKDRSAIGIGGGILFWQDRILHPVFFQLLVHPSSWCDDCSLNNLFWQRISVDAHIGTMIGRIETTDGPLRTDFLSEAGIRYRLGTSDRSRTHIGIHLSMFTLRGPYRILVDGAWRNERISFITIGPSFWLTF